MNTASTIIGIDIGGTYTDFVLYQNGKVKVLKVPSTPEDPSGGAIAGIGLLNPPAGFEVIHGSTVGTNAILERKGAKTALLVTKGFGDLLHIGRQTRTQLYTLTPGKVEPLVRRESVFEVDERIDFQGKIIKPATVEDIEAILGMLSARKIESVAVCLLFSFVNDDHEKMISSRAGAKDYSLSLSSEILPEFREYERCSTTVLNAYINPVMTLYLEELSARISAFGAKSLWMMQSSGGIFSVENARKRAVHTILSGPAAGVAGAFAVARDAGFTDIITIDMGGTSTDVSLCEGSLPLTREGFIDGHPVRIPILDIHTIGAGGGSIAYLDEGGALKVGPESAGADPGPVSLGKGRNITVTDAHLILGRLPDDEFLEGARKLDKERAFEFIGPMAAKMGCSAIEAAWGIIQVVQAQMEGALRVVSLQRGYDPRLFTLLSFGGAGPLHACELADALNIPRVIIPRYPGVLSALGMVMASNFMEFSRTVKTLLSDLSPVRMSRIFDSLKLRAVAALAVEEPFIAYEYYLGMRYRGQAYELMVPLSDFDQGKIAKDFITLHHRRYGYVRGESGIEAVTFGLKATCERDEIGLSWEGEPLAGEGTGNLKVWWSPGGSQLSELSFSLIRRDMLSPGSHVEGPAIVLQYDCTTIIPPHWSGFTDKFGNMILTEGEFPVE